MNTTAIKTERLTRDFKTVRALDGLSLEVPKGIVFGFLGPNGSGKTTTLRLLLGLLEPTEGAALVFGYDSRTHGHEVRKHTGALLEYSGLYERLSAEDNLEFYGRVWLMSAAERRERIKELLKHAGLYERRKERAGTWSRGMKQRLAVCRAILHRPSLLFLDEPTAGLDPIASAALRDEIAGLVKSEGLTVFLTTHNLSEAEKLCSMIGVINRGKLLTVGHPSELRAQAGKSRVTVTGRGFTEKVISALETRPEVISAAVNDSGLTATLSGDRPIAPLIKLMVTEGVEIEEIRKGTASLEEAFLKLMEEKRVD